MELTERLDVFVTLTTDYITCALIKENWVRFMQQADEHFRKLIELFENKDHTIQVFPATRRTTVACKL